MITINANQIMIEQYSEVMHVTPTEIRVKMKLQEITVKGMNLQVMALSKYEILLEGKVEGMLFHDTK